MFGDYYSLNGNSLIEKVDFQIQSSTHYKAADKNRIVIIDTSLARVYINNDTYFTNVPETVWKASFEGESTPELFLKEKIGDIIGDQEISEFQSLLSDLIDAEFRAKSQN